MIIMIIERAIHYEKELNLNSIVQEPKPLEKIDVLDDNTDIYVSLKLEDNEGNILMIIEAMPLCIDADEPNFNIQGCFIRRFEYVEQLLSSPFNSVVDKCIKTFAIRIKNRYVPLQQEGYLTQYQYVWTKKELRNECIIAAILKLPAIKKLGSSIIYSEKTQNWFK